MRKVNSLQFTVVSCLLIFLSLLFTAHCTLTTNVFAAGEFISSYKTVYDIDAEGITSVDEAISLKNTTSTLYASNFSLTISATNITDVSASDLSGPMKVDVTKEGLKTRINVVFNQQVTGKDKINTFNLKFKSSDFAQKIGNIWQVSIPKLTSGQDVDKYNLNVLVPVQFGEIASISPEPINQTEAVGKINLEFDKTELLKSGVLVSLGTDQLFDFNLIYNLQNNGFLPTIEKIAIPASSPYQQVVIQSIVPEPDNVVTDSDGNYVAFYKLSRRQNLMVSVAGQAKIPIDMNTKSVAQLLPAEIKLYTKAQKYWDRDNPIIEAKVSELLKNLPGNTTNQQKAQIINQFVVGALQFDSSKINNQSTNRLGAVTALSNPDSALAQDFTDTFIALARAANIPAREVIGYSYSSSSELRPLSFNKGNLHVWPEYFDPDLGWVMIDPTWENTTGGVDYFSHPDFNRLKIVVRGSSSEQPAYPTEANIRFADIEFQSASNVQTTLKIPKQIFVGFPANARLTIENKGNITAPAFPISVTGEGLIFDSFNVPMVPALPPFGSVEYNFKVRTPINAPSSEKIITVKTPQQSTFYKVMVQSFFSLSTLPILVIILGGSILGIYFLTLGYHVHVNRSSHSSGSAKKEKK